MPITPSARKSLRVSIRRRQENRLTKEAMRQAIKKASVETLPQVFSILDKAAKKHTLHPNKAARLKSRLAKSVSNEEATPKPKAAPKKTAAKKSSKSKTTTKKTTAKKK